MTEGHSFAHDKKELISALKRIGTCDVRVLEAMNEVKGE